MLHIFSSEFEQFAHAYAAILPSTKPSIANSEEAEWEDEFHVWNQTENYSDIFDNWDYLEKLIKPSGTCIYTAAIHQEGFTQWICKYRSLFPSVAVVGIIAHGAKDFQPYSLLGCLRFCKEEGANVVALIGKDNEDKLEYYGTSIGFVKHDVKMLVVDAQIINPLRKKETREETKPIVVQDPHAPRVNTVNKVMPSTSEDFFTINRNGGIDEIVARGEIWENWEERHPHSVTNAHWAGFPLYMNPGDIILVGNIVQWWKPQLIVEMNSWKFGLTSFLLQVTENIGSKIIAINKPIYAEKDGPWAKKLIKELPGTSDRVNLIHVNPEDPRGVLDTYTNNNIERALFLVNYHSMNELVGCARTIFKNTPNQSIVMFHATTNRDVPRFIKDFKKKPGVHSVNIEFTPPGGSWYHGGIFTFNRAEAE
jgi:cephalosporin hydroxylase/riboflavin synthase